MTHAADAGLQPERTALSWRRTCLSLLTASLLATRILAELLGFWACIVGIFGAACALILVFAVDRRCTGIPDDARSRLAGVKWTLAVTASATMVGVASLVGTLLYVLA